MGGIQDLNRWRRPEIFLAELLNKSVRGDFLESDNNVQILYRASVVAVDVYGGKLQNPAGIGHVEHSIGKEKIKVDAITGPLNPRNSIKARILTDGFDQFYGDSSLRVFWPLLPEFDSVPIKPGEHVYVIFEDEQFQHGMWLGKVPGHEGANYVKGADKYKTGDDDRLISLFDENNVDETFQETDKTAGDRLVTTNKIALFNNESE